MKSSRIQLAPAYLLHHAPWRDSSRILEFFTRDHGRISVFARGVRGPKSSLAGILQPFLPLLISWSARSDAGTLTGAELHGAVDEAGLPPGRIMSGFYLNELLIRLLLRHDSHPQLFDHYAASLSALKTDESEARVLRIFEKRLLEAVGYGLDLERETASGATVDESGHYYYRAERGVARAEESSTATYAGTSLYSLARESLCDEGSLKDARRLLREALHSCLEGRELRSREVAAELRRYKP